MDLYDKTRNPIALGKFYTDHVAAMTAEGLHSKSDIAAELAYRDKRIAALEAEKAERERQEPVAWLVMSENGPEFAAGWKEAAHEHINECIEMGVPGSAKWVVRPAYIHPLAIRKPAHSDDAAVDEFATRLKAKLAKARAKGRYGWNDPAWPPADINRQMWLHASKGDPLDVAAYAMFLSLRGEATIAPTAIREPTDEECELIYQNYVCPKVPCEEGVSDAELGRLMVAAVRGVMK